MFSLDQDSLARAEERGELEVARTTFAQNYQASRASFLKNDLSISREEALSRKLFDQQERAKVLGFQLEGESSVTPPIVGGEGPTPLELPSQTAKRLRADYDRRVTELNQRLPEGEDRFLTIGELRERVVTEAKAERERAEEIASRAGLGGDVGGVIGGLVGSMHDPINIGVVVATAPLAATSLIRFAATEALLSGTSEALIQTRVVPFLMEQGLSREEALSHAQTSVLAATLLGGLFAGAAKLGGAAIGRVVRRVRGKPQLDLDGILAEYERLDAEGRLTPEQSEALVDLKEAVAAERSNTLGDTPEAIDRHVANLTAAEEAAAAGRRTSVPHPAREAIEAEPLASPRTEAVEAVRAARAGQTNEGVRAKYRLHDFDDLLDEPEFAEVAQVLSRETLDDLRKGVPAPEAQRIIDAIKKLGGIKLGQELIADLEARGVTPKTGPGLFRKAGSAKGARPPRDLDELRQDLHDLGFFPEKPEGDDITLDELIDAIARDRSGEPVTNASVNQGLDHDARMRNAADAERFLEELGIDHAKLDDKELAFTLREKLIERGEREGLEAHEHILARLAPDQAQLEAEALARMADDLDGRLAEVRGRIALDDEGNVVLNAQESAAFPAEDIKIALEDGTILSAREVLDMQAERAKAIEDFTACALGVAAG